MARAVAPSRLLVLFAAVFLRAGAATDGPTPAAPPTFSPSTNAAPGVVERACRQTLEVEGAAALDPAQVGIYQCILESYTKDFGRGVGPPEVETRCEVGLQELVVADPAAASHALALEFTMTFEGRGVGDYPERFRDHINGNLAAVTEDMTLRSLPVARAGEVVVLDTAWPSASPSLGWNASASDGGGTSLVEAECQQVLEVQAAARLDDDEAGAYQRLMENYTANFGHRASAPRIVATCRVEGQDLARGKDATDLLVVSFAMRYESASGEDDVGDYPRLLRGHVNGDLGRAAEDLAAASLPVVRAGELIVFDAREPEASPVEVAPTNGGRAASHSLFAASIGRVLLFLCAAYTASVCGP